MDLNIALVGDINLKRDLAMSADTALSEVASELELADVRLGNLEGAFSDPTVELDYKPHWVHVEPEMAKALVGHFDALGCANNTHYGEAIVDSVGHLDALGIAHSGAGANRSEARRPGIVVRGEQRLGLLSFTSVFWPIGAAATDSSPGVATIRADTAYQPHPRVRDMPGAPAIVRSFPDKAELAEACGAVAALRGEVDALVVYMHWGISVDPQVAEYQQIIGHGLIDAGADLVVGAHSHLPGPIEVYGRGAILYSLGNFIFGAAHHREFSRTGLLARARVNGQGLLDLSLVPVARSDEDQARILSVESGEGAEIARDVIRASSGFGTVAALDNGAITVKLSA